MINTIIYDIIKKPILTEKSNHFESLGKYVFTVSPNSNKFQIKKAAEKIFKIKIKSIKIINNKKKIKVFKGKKGETSGLKKTIITIESKKNELLKHT